MTRKCTEFGAFIRGYLSWLSMFMIVLHPSWMFFRLCKQMHNGRSKSEIVVAEGKDKWFREKQSWLVIELISSVLPLTMQCTASSRLPRLLHSEQALGTQTELPPEKNEDLPSVLSWNKLPGGTENALSFGLCKVLRKGLWEVIDCLLKLN